MPMLSMCALLAAVGISAGVLGLRRLVVIVEVSGVSMLPALQPGDRVLARRVAARRIHTGDIVVYRVPELMNRSVTDRQEYRDSWRIKRVAAVSGEPVPQLPRPPLPGPVPLGPPLPGIGFDEISAALAARPVDDAVVPDRSLFVLGDNAAQSVDSRHTGSVSCDDVYGVVWCRLSRPSPSSR